MKGHEVLAGFYEVSGQHDQYGKNLLTLRAAADQAVAEGGQCVAEAEEEKKEARLRFAAEDAEALEAVLKGGGGYADFQPDSNRVLEADARGDHELRRRKAALHLRDGIDRQIRDYLASPGFHERHVEPAYEEIIGWMPKDRTPHIKVVQMEAAANQAIKVFERLMLARARADGADNDEKRELRKALQARPPVMPTLHALRRAKDEARRNSPQAIAQREAEAREVAHRGANRRAAAEHARLNIEWATGHGADEVNDRAEKAQEELVNG